MLAHVKDLHFTLTADFGILLGFLFGFFFLLMFNTYF